MKQLASKKKAARPHLFLKLIILVVALVTLTLTASSSALSGSVANSAQATGQETKPTEVGELKLGAPVERELTVGVTHSYSVSLTQGQYFKLVVDQKGIDVVIRLFGPDGQKLIEVDETPAAVPEFTFLIAEAAGAYRVEVEPSKKDANPGTYQIKIEELRESTAKDRVQVSARKVEEEGNKLRDQ